MNDLPKQRRRSTLEGMRHRPIVRLANTAGRVLRRWGLKRPLTVDAVLEAACRRTGCDTFAEKSFLEPLAVLVDSLERDGDPSPFGRFLLRRHLSQFAANRLFVERESARYPEALEIPIDRPIFVVGLPRTGTTLLYNLLCLLPGTRGLRTHEAFFPVCPTPPGKRDPRMRWVRTDVRVGRFLMPAIQHVHPVDPSGYEECTWLLAHTFRTVVFDLLARVTSYLDWLFEQADETFHGAYREYAVQLQLLQRPSPALRWVLKSPVHLPTLDALLAVLPDATIIQTHRHPAECVPSACSLFAIMRSLHTNAVDAPEWGRETAARLSRYLGRALRTRSAHPERFLDVDYRHLVRDPIGVVRSLARRLGIVADEAWEARAEAFLARSRAQLRKGHHYSLEQFGLDQHRLEEYFGEYSRHFELDADHQTVRSARST